MTQFIKNHAHAFFSDIRTFDKDGTFQTSACDALSQSLLWRFASMSGSGAKYDYRLETGIISQTGPHDPLGNHWLVTKVALAAIATVAMLVGVVIRPFVLLFDSQARAAHMAVVNAPGIKGIDREAQTCYINSMLRSLAILWKEGQDSPKILAFFAQLEEIDGVHAEARQALRDLLIALQGNGEAVGVEPIHQFLDLLLEHTELPLVAPDPRGFGCHKICEEEEAEEWVKPCNTQFDSSELLMHILTNLLPEHSRIVWNEQKVVANTINSQRPLIDGPFTTLTFDDYRQGNTTSSLQRLLFKVTIFGSFMPNYGCLKDNKGEIIFPGQHCRRPKLLTNQPPFLFLQGPRFRMPNEGVQERSDASVTAEKELYIPQFNQNGRATNLVVYRRVASVVHSTKGYTGKSLRGGHYYTYQDHAGQMFEHNEELVRPGLNRGVVIPRDRQTAEEQISRDGYYFTYVKEKVLTLKEAAPHIENNPELRDWINWRDLPEFAIEPAGQTRASTPDQRYLHTTDSKRQAR